MFQLPAIFIPYPYANAHQKENASVLCGEGSAQVIEDHDLSCSRLAETILTVLGQPDKKMELGDVCFSDSVQRLVKEAICLTQ
jgi:UDP-N-acetylglucosamine:LPS N-acetylglucosamine transferase